MVWVTRHAAIRYAQRKLNVPYNPENHMEYVRDILCEGLDRAVRSGAKSFKKDGWTYIIEGDCVVTMVKGNMSNKNLGGEYEYKSKRR